MTALVRAFLVGAASGGRSQAGITAVRLTARDAGALSRLAVGSAAIGELVADKHSDVPSRLSLPGLAPRVLLGATAAAVLARRTRGAVTVAALVGAGASVGGAIMGAAWRQAAANTGIPAVSAAIGEDVLCYALAFTACAGS
ncbi:hypothetical protein [Embleya scabrispora]|uniref:hypothetical protein n=1 Tax=Embleya scabrispora TaxID=159449 RepID=UPI00037BC305|nr:hypothetical protein [Embleya scabrispora]MYS81414.1 hypothetical protein [Streptomyces sp. SID5474]